MSSERKWPERRWPWSSIDDEILVEEIRRGGEWLERAAYRLSRPISDVSSRCGEISTGLGPHETRAVLTPAASVAVASPERKATKRLWTDAEVVELKRLLALGLTRRRIASHLGYSFSVIHHKMRALGLHGLSKKGAVVEGEVIRLGNAGAWRPREIKTLRELMAAEIPYADIATELGRPLKGVTFKANELGFRRSVVWTAEEDRYLLGLAKLGLSMTYIARKMNRSLYSAKSRLHTLRHPERPLRERERMRQKRAAMA